MAGCYTAAPCMTNPNDDPVLPDDILPPCLAFELGAAAQLEAYSARISDLFRTPGHPIVREAASSWPDVVVTQVGG
jgi:hypothetical protein